jgi:hypothetical protein
MVGKVSVVSLCLVVCFAVAWSYGGNTDGRAGVENKAMARVAAQVASLKDVSDLSADERRDLLKDMSSALAADETGHKEEVRRYAANALVCLGRLSSWDWGSSAEEESLEQRMALRCLRNRDDVTIETERRLVGHLRPDLDAGGRQVAGLQWQELRNTLTEHRLHLWRRIENAIDASWDSNDVGWVNVPVPLPANIAVPGGRHAGVYMSGMDPNGIKDPDIRRAYEAALDANRRIADRYIEQTEVRRMREVGLRQLRMDIPRSYGMSPVTEDDLEVLDAYLRIYVADKKLRSELSQAAKDAARRAQTAKPRAVAPK